MTDSRDVAEALDLKELAGRLSLAGMPAQTVIARECEVSQSTVSRASQGLIKTPSEGAQRLWAYTTTRLDVIAAAPPDRPARSIRKAAAGPRRRPTRRHRVDQKSGTDVSTLSRADLDKLALSGLKDYLADAFDPMLVIEQLSVLRRAQDRGPR